MTDTLNISFKEFFEQKMQALKNFERFWKYKHTTKPEQYPMELYSGDWDEQFRIFEEQDV